MQDNPYKPIIFKQDPLANNVFMRMFKNIKFDSPKGGHHSATLYRNIFTYRCYIVLGSDCKGIGAGAGAFTFKEVDQGEIEAVIAITIRQLLIAVDKERLEVEDE